MKRVIEGKAYNTDTALHVAGAEKTYTDDQNREHTVLMNLYRTKGGAFFLVEDDDIDDADYCGRVTFYPVKYDTAHTFVRGEKLTLGAWTSEAWQIERRVDDIFPSVPEAAEPNSKFDLNAAIYLLATKNPKKEGSASCERFSHYKDGMTVKEALDAGLTRSDLAWDVGHKFISIGGEKPETKADS